MRVATFNLENLEDRPGRHGEGAAFAQRLAVLRPQLERLDADILCLQEVGARRADGERRPPRTLRALDRLLAGTAYEGFHRVVSTNRDGTGPLDVQNLVVLGRVPPTSARQYWHSLVPPPAYAAVTAEPPQREPAPVAWDRPILHVEFPLADGSRLHVLTMHFRAPLAAYLPGQKIGPFAWRTTAGWAEGFYIAMLKRAGQALEARLAVDRVFDADPEARVILCGDMNAEAFEVPLRILCAEEEDTANGALAGRVLVPLERGVPESQRFSVLHAGRRLMLDHVLVSRPLLAAHRRVEIHNEALADEVIGYATVRRSPESYHAPVVAEFELALKGGAPGS